MRKERKLSDAECFSLAQKIRAEIFKPVVDYKLSVFLCGADRKNTNSIRGRLAESLLGKWYSYHFTIIYPEDIFEELLYSPDSPDILTLETLLATNVDAVVIIPESPGSIAELGAFSNSPVLKKKVVCVLDKKYKKDKSFINRGPVRLISEVNRDRVLYIDPTEINEAAERLRTVLRPMKSVKDLGQEVTFFQIPNFLLPAIHLLEPIDKATLVKLISGATGDVKHANTLTISGLSSLEKEGFLEVTGSKYKLTQAGYLNYLRLRNFGSRRKTSTETKLLDEIRLEIFNLRYRKKRLTI